MPTNNSLELINKPEDRAFLAYLSDQIGGGGGGGASDWGDIGGTLSDQTDLQAELDAKEDALGFTAVPNTRTVNGHALSSNVTVTKGDVGLGNVDNTSDVNKPVSTAQQAAIDTKQTLDSDLTQIAAIISSNDDIIQKKAGSWTNRTPSQLKTDQSLNNVENTALSTWVGSSNLNTFGNNSVTNAFAAQMAANTIKGNNTGSTANAIDLTVAQTKTLLSISNVENTALSTWAGSANLTTLGTIGAFDATTAHETTDVDKFIVSNGTRFKNRTGTEVKSDIDLGNVDNTADTAKPVSTAQQTALNLKEDLTNKSTNTSLGSSNTLYPTQNAVKTYVDLNVAGLLDDRGNYDASTNLFPAAGGSGGAGAVLKGDIWTISVTGTLGGVVYAVGDLVRALVDTPGQTAGNWARTSTGLGYTAENTANKDTDGTLAANSDTKYASQKATKTYADTKVTGNTAITGATKTKITYDTKGLITSGADATTADIADSSNKRYITDAQQTVIGNTSGTNSGDVTKSGENYLSLTGQAFTANAVDLSGTNATGILAAARHPALTGDVTTSSGAVATTIGANKVVTTMIAASNVTYAKIQDISATGVLLGRKTAGAGATEEITPAGDLTLSGSTFTIGTNKITNAKAAQMTTLTLKGNNTGSTADPLDLSVSQVRTQLTINNVDNTSDANKPVSTATQTALNLKQDLDSDLTAIAAIAPTNDDIIQRKAGAWTNRTMVQLKTDLSLVKGDVGLSNVDNTSDLGKPISTATQAALDLKQAALQFYDEGVGLGTSGTAISIDFTGAGITASRSVNAITVNVPGGAGGDIAPNLRNAAASQTLSSYQTLVIPGFYILPSSKTFTINANAALMII